MQVVEKSSEIVPRPMVIELYRKMITTYYIEERVKVFVRQGKCSFQASTRGHEKVQIGMTMLLKPKQDWFFTYYREKAIAVGLGMPIKDVFLGMLGREGDPNSNGRNMPEHFSSRELHLVSQTACTGTQFLPAVGLAKSLRMEGSDAVVYVSSGEGATSEGEFFEALNWAARERCPVLFVIQNNGYAISVPQDTQTISEVHRIARGFGMPTFDLDGTWFEPMYQTIPPVIERIRAGHGPALVEAQVVRIDPHSSSDDQKKYRSVEELEDLVERDPILQTEKYLLKNKIQTEEELAAMREEISRMVNQAADEADQAAFPDPQQIMANIYSEPQEASECGPPNYLSTEPVNMVSALNSGLHEEMENNPRIVMWGEDIADPKGGVFGVTRGLSTAYPERVENSALAEASIVGVAGGLALNGYKPIVEIQFADYSWPAYMQIRNEIATVRWRSNNEWKCPVVIRIACGGYIKGGPWHSTCVEGLYSHTPGWFVVFPSCAEDAKGLIKMAARSEDPVIFLEHKGLYRRLQAKSLEPDAQYVIPFGKGRIRREGSDLTIVTWGTTVYLALDIAKELEAEKVSIEVIDLRSIVPMDNELVFASVRKTNRVLVAHEDGLTMGFGAEVAARIAENCFDSLDAPVSRLGAKDCFVASSPNLEAAVLPGLEDMRAAVKKLLSY
ncbi:MAG: dehydrogenase E1 component subunit alpha/beta [Acidobacteriia bacterium]|nr:dehydrogenase E1 component subunit alpha/beta [Terriglobia bacterium]